MSVVWNMFWSKKKSVSVAALFMWSLLAAAAVLLGNTPARAQDIPSLPAKNYSPMTKKERWNEYLNDNFLKQGAYFRALGSSLGDSTANKPEQWGGSSERYSLNLASQFARFAIAGTVQSSMAAALGYDTRYHRCDCKGGWKRAENALSRTFLTYDSAGHRRVDVPGLSGIYAGSMLMMYWYPRGYEPLKDGVRNGNIAVGVTAGIYLIKEFSPELKKAFHRRL